MKNNKRKKISRLALIIIFLLGIVFTLVSIQQTDPLKTILISVGCSLLATAISTFVLMQDDTQNDILDVLTQIHHSTDALLKPEHALSALKEVGIDIEYYKARNKALTFPNSIEPAQIASATQSGLEKYKIQKQYAVGHRRPTTMKYYYDLIGGTCEPSTAEHFASLLSSFWASNSPCKDVIANADFDFVVTPKGGSPILGYEFAKLIKRPFVLHEEVARFRDNNDDMRKWFNCNDIPPKGTTALIVDDSTTGGTMVSNTIDHLRDYGYVVHTCFVVFEPQIKDAKQRLKNKSVQLVSLIKTHND